MADLEHFIATVGFPIAVTVGILFVIYKLMKNICSVAGDSAKKWFDSQIILAEALKESTEHQIRIMEDLTKHATHGHKAFYYALGGINGLAKNDEEAVMKNTDKAKDSLLYDENEE